MSELTSPFGSPLAAERELLQIIGRVRRRVRLLVMQRWVLAAMAVSASVGIALIAASRTRIWPEAEEYLLWVLAAGAALGAALGWSRGVSHLSVARLLDERAGLKERLTTGVEISQSKDRSPVAVAQLEDATLCAKRLVPAQVIPWKLPPQARWALAAMAVLAGAWFLPEVNPFRSAQDRLERETMRTEGQRIQQVARQIERDLQKRKSETNEQIMRRVAQQMRRLGRDQERGRVSKKAALLKLNELQKSVEDARRQNEAESRAKDGAASDRLQQLAREAEKRGDHQTAEASRRLADNLQRGDVEGVKKQLQEMTDQLRQGEMSPEQLQKAAETLAAMSEGLSDSSLKAAAEQLKQAASQLKSDSQQTRDLQQKLASALTPEQKQKLQEALKQAARQSGEQASKSTDAACQACNNPSQSGKNGSTASGNKGQDAASRAADALQAAQRSLQDNAIAKQSDGEASDEEAGREFGSSSSKGSGSNAGSRPGSGESGTLAGNSSTGRGGKSGQAGSRPGEGMGAPGQGYGGNVGAQKPLPGAKRDVLVRGQLDERGQRLYRTYTGTPDPNKDRAAYYSVVPERVRAAEASLGREQIPVRYKDQVRDYFRSIQPQ